MDQPLSVCTINELHYYLTVTACEACGKGPRVVESVRPVPADPSAAQPASPGPTPAPLEAQIACNHCHVKHRLIFIPRFQVAQTPPESETINPTDQPSRLIDLGQWLSLFYLLIEIAVRETNPAESRSVSYRAALCLAEALKFYTGDDQLPPLEAFFTPNTREAFSRYPEKFARQKLRDMRAKLPALDLMGRRIARDSHAQHKKRWWQIWR